jgi:hypothetical protein
MIGEFQLSIFYTTFYAQMAKHITNLFDNLGSLTKGKSSYQGQKALSALWYYV